MHTELKKKSSRAAKPQRDPVRDFHTLPGYLVRRTQQISTALFAEECAAHDLTAVQYASLVAILLHPQIDATRISQFISLDRSTLGNVLERIGQKDGLFARQAHLTNESSSLASPRRAENSCLPCSDPCSAYRSVCSSRSVRRIVRPSWICSRASPYCMRTWLLSLQRTRSEPRW
jgi:DNA-binding MarR family transcriptional regulator